MFYTLLLCTDDLCQVKSQLCNLIGNVSGTATIGKCNVLVSINC